MTLEKDKKDETKYYLSYPKPQFLDIKWANRDVNIVDWANIPKFCVLDDLVTPLRLFELFFATLIWVDMVFGYIKLYCREIRH